MKFLFRWLTYRIWTKVDHTKTIYNLKYNIIERSKVISIERSFYDWMYVSNTWNSYLDDLPFDDDKRLITRQQILYKLWYHRNFEQWFDHWRIYKSNVRRRIFSSMNWSIDNQNSACDHGRFKMSYLHFSFYLRIIAWWWIDRIFFY